MTRYKRKEVSPSVVRHDPAEVLSAAQIAVLLDRSKQDVLADLKTGRIPSLIDPRGKRAVPYWFLLEWLAKKEADAPPAPRDYKPGRHGIPLTVRFAVLTRCNYTCVYCGRKPPEVVLHVDHVVPVAKGGRNNPENLTAACRDCNLGKRAELIGENR